MANVQPKFESESVNLGCPACREMRCHTEEEWKHHPLRGHGFDDGKWSHPDAEAEHKARVAKLQGDK